MEASANIKSLKKIKILSHWKRKTQNWDNEVGVE
jgi:hypothetical protein